MKPIFALTFLAFVYLFGEIVAEKTRARLSITLVISITLLIGFGTLIPKTIFEDSKIIPFSMNIVGLLLTSLGTRINFRELRKQWRTVVIALTGTSISVLGIIAIGSFIINRQYALAGAPIFAGGNAAALVMMEKLNTIRFKDVQTFCIMMLITQGFVGIPVSSYLLRREAKEYIENKKYLEKRLTDITKKAYKVKFNMPDVLDRPMGHFVRLGIVTSFASVLSSATGIHYFIICLLLGIVFYEIGFLEEDSLKRTDSANLVLFLTTLVIFSNLADVTIFKIIELLYPLLICLFTGLIFAVFSGYFLAKVFRISYKLAISLILTCTFGFPTTFFIPNEVAEAIGRNETEKKIIVDYLEPKMLTAGFITVTIFSVIIAGVLVKFL
ncbi:hypothetical protein [Peptoniphilus indolicus]|uniref:Uncharacterized protein n=2 Tax=Peptoniphilus indolicus TaxID=33030 RepID=G4D2N1_9FIRM|nr:hypothetical protein [Peptoniphilus indolicus]EGY80214.1 hypothetical protein HMPREF9129_0661 [Peptoniphilus indolicus ATCC 29427]SUB75255.1 Uncharacterised protein [Peptoniphilus indolicus]